MARRSRFAACRKHHEYGFLHAGNFRTVDETRVLTHRCAMVVLSKYSSWLWLVLMMALCANPASADYDAGVEAYTAGDYAAALAEWQGLAEAGDPDSQFGMGLIYESGRGVGRDYRTAASWYTQAAEQGHAPAQFNLGHLLRLGAGVEPDMEEAVRWWTAAAENNLQQAQVMLGLAYQRGEGVPFDQAQSINWFQRAADQGNAMGQYAIGFAYETGSGLAQDLDLARAYYEQAAAGGLEQAVDRLTALAFPSTEEEPPPPPNESEVMERMASDVEEAGTEQAVQVVGSGLAGPVYIQIAAYVDQDRAGREWENMTSRHADLLDGLPHRVVTVERENNDPVYRLQAGPMPIVAEAEIICANLKQRGADCFLVRE